MSLGDRSETVGFLRQAIARIESDGQGHPVRAANVTRAAAIAFGAQTALDHALKGGMTRGALHEIVAASAADAPAASGFALAMASRFAASKPKGVVVWIIEDRARTETGALYAPGLAAYGIDPADLLVVQAANGQDALWVLEEALKCRAVAAVVAEIYRLKTYDLAASRRLVLAAGRNGTPALLVPAGAAGQAGAMSSAAHMRLEVRALPSRRVSSAGDRVPLPGRTAWAVRIARIRAGPDGSAFALDPHHVWPVLWDHDEVCFRDAFPFPLPAPARERPYPAPANRPASAAILPLARAC